MNFCIFKNDHLGWFFHNWGFDKYKAWGDFFCNWGLTSTLMVEGLDINLDGYVTKLSYFIFEGSLRSLMQLWPGILLCLLARNLEIP